MFVFGYRNPSSGFVRAIICMLLGLALMVWPDRSGQMVVRIIGIAAIISGIISIAVTLRLRRTRALAVSATSAFVTSVFGILLLLYPDPFIKVVMFIIGLVLTVFGIHQTVSLFSARSYVTVSVFNYIFAIIAALAGIVIIFKPFKTVSVFMIFIGASIFVYGVSSILAAFKMRNAIKAFKEANSPAPDLKVDRDGFSEYEDVTGK